MERRTEPVKFSYCLKEIVGQRVILFRALDKANFFLGGAEGITSTV
jgi:hypothetical protein